MDLNLKNKKVLITGSTRGIGLNIAKSFVEEGAIVGINSRNLKEIKRTIKSMGGKNLHPIVGDVTNLRDVKRIYNLVVKSMGGIDILVCNVGSGKSVIAGKETLKEWRRVFDINLWSATNMVEIFKKDLSESKGNIVCISSICGHEYIKNAPLTYSVAKNALNAYVKLVSKELGNFKIRINAVAPGNILFDGSIWSKKIKENKNKIKKLLLNDVALNKLGSTEDISNLVLLLASNRSVFTTGSIFVTDGGQLKGI